MEYNQKAINSGWQYSKQPHNILNLNFAFRDTKIGREIMFEDKVKYSEKEVFLLLKKNGTNKTIHNIKKIFGGIIIK